MNFFRWIFSLSLFGFLVIGNSYGSYKGSISFTREEIKNHKSQIRGLVSRARKCLLNFKEEHLNFYQENCRQIEGKKVCLSKFYGDRRYSKNREFRRSDGKLLEFLPDALKDNGFNPQKSKEMRAISCIGMALQCLEEGFSQTGQRDQWNKINRFVRKNNVSGTALQHALSKIGWTTLYWNPSPHWRLEDDAQKWDKEEKNWASKGWHSYRYQMIMRRGTYWYNNVDDFEALVGFEKNVPEIMKKHPFWVGTAHTGYHVFPGTFGKVVEAHSTRHITSIDNLEFSDFSPMKAGGGPRWTGTEKYRSGLMAFPPL